jgi:hypothetical protein
VKRAARGELLNAAIYPWAFHTVRLPLYLVYLPLYVARLLVRFARGGAR